MHLEFDLWFPFLAWARRYDKGALQADIVAGLSVAVVAIPQSMAYALIAGLPVEYGLYASMVPTVVGCLWGSSAHLITGPTTATSLVVFATLAKLASPGTAAFVELGFILALLAGGVRLGLGLARLGALLNYVSHSVILGFTAGAGLIIACKQLPNLLGVEVARGGVFVETIMQVLSHLAAVHWLSFALGLLTVVVILGCKRVRPTWPGTLLAVIVAAVLVALFDLDLRGVAVVGAIPRRLPPLHLPDLGVLEMAAADLADLAPGAIAIAILGLMEAISISRAIAAHTHQRLDANQEFIGQGLANVAASMFSGYPVSGSFTRSAVNYRAGARTPFSGVVSAVAVALVVLVAAPLASYLPIASLAGVLLVAAYEMVDKKGIFRAVRATRSDGAVLIITFLATLVLHIEFAIYVGVLLSIGLHLAKTSHPRIYSTIPDPETRRMVGSTHGVTCCQMDIVQVEGSIFFGSANYVLEDFLRRLKSHPYTANLLLRMHQVNVLDASGVHVLEIVLEEVRDRGGGLYFSGVNPRVFEVFKNSGLLWDVGEGALRRSTSAAIRHAMRETFCPAICAACDYLVFVECSDLKQGNWEVLGEGVRPRQCARARRAVAASDSTAERGRPGA